MAETNPRLFASHAAIAHALLRLTLGAAMLMQALVRIHAGVMPVADKLADTYQSAGSLLPRAAVHGFAVALPFVEGALGLLLVAGFLTLPSLVVAGLWIVINVVGASTVQDWQAVGIWMGYAVTIFLLIIAQPFDQWSVDSVIRGRR